MSLRDLKLQVSARILKQFLAKNENEGKIDRLAPGHLARAISETVENMSIDNEWYTEVFAWGSNHAG